MINSNWIRTIRNKQGLKGFELARRLRVSPARVSVLEKDEARGAVTLKMMDKVARAMGCRFEYRIVQQTDITEKTPQGEKPHYRVVVESETPKEKGRKATQQV